MEDYLLNLPEILKPLSDYIEISKVLWIFSAFLALIASSIELDCLGKFIDLWVL
jgi:hypothetical protein